MERVISIGNNHSSYEFPNKCPICHTHSEMEVALSSLMPDRSIQVVYRCGFSGCRSFFIGFYESFGGKLLNYKPQKADPNVIPNSVRDLSPSFVTIYREAEDAKSHGLYQIAGPGYRKAFEFLVKDYAKSLDPEKSEQIENMFSGKVVNEFISDPRIQMVAKRALWLGNDETHYLRKWAEHDLDDLITLIRLAINWVEIERLSAQYEESMPG
ncbi:TPA: DUF4145 domain-containing protein [Vibrio parahaemolyticus]|nr:DUF4145 domain-containing protein [Vibrio parahaemolyticus]